MPVMLFTGDAEYAYEFGLCQEAGLTYFVDRGAPKPKNSAEQEPATVSEGAITNLTLLRGDISSGMRQRIKRLPVIGALLMKARNIYLRCFVTKTAFIRLPWHINRMRELGRNARAILEIARPDVMVFPHINLGEILGCIAVEAKRHGIPVVVIPYTWIFRDEIMKALIGKPEYQTFGLINRWVSKRYPQWLFQGYFFLPPVKIIAIERSKYSTANPWMADSIADVIALDSEVVLRSYVGDGVPADKCTVTGSASHDILARAAFDTRISKAPMTIQTNRPNVDVPFALSFLPPDQTPNQMAGFEYSSYWEMLLYWIETAMAHDATPAIFSLHPRMKSLRSSLLAHFPKINIFAGDACELIPHAKFCVGQFGGMMRYAIACAKPVLYYDVFAYNIEKNEFTVTSSMVTVKGREAFAGAYARFATNRAFLSTLEENASVNAPKWGKLDGHAVERIEALLEAQCLQSNSL